MKLQDFIENEENIKSLDDTKLNELHLKIHIFIKKLDKFLKRNPDMSIEEKKEKFKSMIEDMESLHKIVIEEITNRGISCKCGSILDSISNIHILTSGLKYTITRPVVSKFIIHKHDTDRKKGHPHFDLRIENNPNDKTLYSWALPKGIPDKFGEKLLAVFTEPHDPKWYDDFDDVTIPKGQYGAGKVDAHNKGRVVKWSANRYNIVFSIIEDNVGELKKYDTFVLHKIKYNNWVIFKVKNNDKYKKRLDSILEKGDN